MEASSSVRNEGIDKVTNTQNRLMENFAIRFIVNLLNSILKRLKTLSNIIFKTKVEKQENFLEPEENALSGKSKHDIPTAVGTEKEIQASKLEDNALLGDAEHDNSTEVGTEEETPPSKSVTKKTVRFKDQELSSAIDIVNTEIDDRYNDIKYIENTLLDFAKGEVPSPKIGLPFFVGNDDDDNDDDDEDNYGFSSFYDTAENEYDLYSLAPDPEYLAELKGRLTERMRRLQNEIGVLTTEKENLEKQKADQYVKPDVPEIEEPTSPNQDVKPDVPEIAKQTSSDLEEDRDTYSIYDEYKEKDDEHEEKKSQDSETS